MTFALGFGEGARGMGEEDRGRGNGGEGEVVRLEITLDWPQKRKFCL